MRFSLMHMTRAFAAGIVFTTAGCAGLETAPAGKPLYDRLGGHSAITAMVDQFIAHVANDTRINGRFATTDFQKLKGALADQLCVVTGGPCAYVGRDMRMAHKGMKITEEEFAVFVGNMGYALERVKVTGRTREELMQLLEDMKKDIVD